MKLSQITSKYKFKMNIQLETLVQQEFITEDWAYFLEEPILNEFYPNILPNLVGKQFYPQHKEIFRAFKECPLDKLKVVIVAQDPYHDGAATGVAFDNLRTNKKISPSLRNVLSEMRSDVGTTGSEDSYLGHLPAQGVLLINAALTVAPKSPLSHQELWENFSKGVVSKINTKDNIVWVLWGKWAQSLAENITNPTHHIIKGAHPSPYSASKFLGGKYFSQVNTWLKSKLLDAIEW